MTWHLASSPPNTDRLVEAEWRDPKNRFLARYRNGAWETLSGYRLKNTQPDRWREHDG